MAVKQQKRFPETAQIAGMLQEEVMLYLLEASGYTPISSAFNDPTLHQGSNGLEVKGRGGQHQIDAIADFAIQHLYVQPQRLLVEAKFRKDDPIGIEVMRNAVGILQDVNTYWDQERQLATATRYSYQYAVLSSSGYTANAKTYALVHGIYLIYLDKLAFIQAILNDIKNIVPTVQIKPDGKKRLPPSLYFRLPALRKAIRLHIRDEHDSSLSQIVKEDAALDLLDWFCSTCRQLTTPFLAIIARKFPVFLTPEVKLDLNDIRDCHVRIYWQNTTWYIQLPNGQRFFFDLPTEILENYLESNSLSELRALDLKANYFSQVQVMIKQGDNVRFVTWHLDMNWLEGIRYRIGQL